MPAQDACGARAAPIWLLAAASITLSACQGGDPENQSAPTNVAEPAARQVPLPEPPIGRSALLTAVAQMASMAAAGITDPMRQRALDGRPFELRIRFGCSGPATDLAGQSLGWSFQPDKGTLRLRARPTISADDPIAAEIAADDIEAVEGFWIPRPWIYDAVCPAAPAPAPSEQPEGEGEAVAPDRPAGRSEPAVDQELQPSFRWPKVGIAQFFTTTDARTGRRDMRAYEAVKSLKPTETPASQGFDLILAGRLRALPDGRVIVCVGGGAERPPDCIVSAQFDAVRMERPEDKTILAQW